jgi:pimeloyl-ACP methyl ester carboxylesterase
VLLALVGCTVVASSIGQLAKHLPSAGSIYTYPAEAIHPALGFLVGWGYSLVEALIGPITMVLCGYLIGSVCPSEFTVTGILRTWDIMDRLGEIAVPTLLVGGRYDECTPGHPADMHARIPGSQLHVIEDASHLCFAEKPAEFATTANSLLDLTERGSPS